MSFDIEKMKRDGVSQRIIDFVSLSLDELILKIGRRVENDSLFKQFMGVSSNMETVLPYAVAAGLITEAERKWLINERNPYKPQSGEVWYTGTLDECRSGWATAILAETDKSETNDIVTNPNSYVVSVGGKALTVSEASVGAVQYVDSIEEDKATIVVLITLIEGEFLGTAEVKCPTDMTTVEVTVTHK